MSPGGHIHGLRLKKVKPSQYWTGSGPIVPVSIQPVWDGKAFQPRLMLPLSLSYDHRVIDGAAAARFNAYLGAVLADYRRILL